MEMMCLVTKTKRVFDVINTGMRLSAPVLIGEGKLILSKRRSEGWRDGGRLPAEDDPTILSRAVMRVWMWHRRANFVLGRRRGVRGRLVHGRLRTNSTGYRMVAMVA
jgi:hypothetical protein